MNEAEFSNFKARIALPLAISVKWLERKCPEVPEYLEHKGVAVYFINDYHNVFAIIIADDKKIKSIRISDLELDA